MFKIQTVERKQSKVKIGLFGISGSGKTYSALKLARGLASDWSKIYIIDSEIMGPTETGSSAYDSLGPFKQLRLDPPYSPDRYILAIDACEKDGAEVIIIDSISHEWEGQGGVLDMVNAFGDWKKSGPKHTAFIEKIKKANTHVICCGRSKTKYEATPTFKNGKDTIEVRKLGIGVISREGFDYELLTAFDINQDHWATTSKDRTGLFADLPAFKIDEKTGEVFKQWAESGKEVTQEELDNKEIESLRIQIAQVIGQKNIDAEEALKIAEINPSEILNVEDYRQALSKLQAV
jgi:hypothetical protein